MGCGGYGVVDVTRIYPQNNPTFDSGFPKQQYQGSNNRQADRSLECNRRGIVFKLFNTGFCSFG